jgi:transposase-like protein
MEEIKGRKHKTAEEKYQIVKDHLTNRRQISETCEKYGLHANNLYRWIDEFFAGALEGMKNKKTGRQIETENKREQKFAEEIKRKDSIIAEVVSENIALKKSIGE